MKYPKSQFDKLVLILKQLNNHFTNIKDINYSHLHFLAYQQVNSGQSHNSFVLTECGQIVKNHTAKGFNFKVKNRLVSIDDAFELYPNDTNDLHIKTAIKNALKQI